MAEAIVKAGHEIGHHGFHHLLPQPGDPMLVEEVDRALEVLKRRLGVVPAGYRAPARRKLRGVARAAEAAAGCCIPPRGATTCGRIGTCWRTARRG